MNRNGRVVASVSIAGPTSRINSLTIDKLTKQVQQAAEQVTAKIKSR